MGGRNITIAKKVLTLYYTCIWCHYTFQSEKQPAACPDCGKETFQGIPMIRPATEEEIEPVEEAKREEW